MATVDYRNGCLNDYDDDADDMLDDPLAVADSEHSDAVRAAVDGGDAGLRTANHLHRRLHRIASRLVGREPIGWYDFHARLDESAVA